MWQIQAPLEEEEEPKGVMPKGLPLCEIRKPEGLEESKWLEEPKWMEEPKGLKEPKGECPKGVLLRELTS